MSKSTESAHAHRKDEHLAIALKDTQQASNSFDQIHIVHQSLPELGQNDVNIQTTFGALTMVAPFYVEAMTGGSIRTGEINEQLATVARETGLAMAVGSQSIALKEPASAQSFAIARKVNPTGLLMANLGAGHSAWEAQDAINMIDANAIEIHVNAAQETVMAEGDADFHWLDNIADIVAKVDVPVIVKEVGFGMTKETAAKLANVGVSYINISGRGGTNFAAIENERRSDHARSYLGDWGQTTVQSLLEVRSSGLTVAASGGVRSPLDVLKALSLGADAVGVGGYFLHYLHEHGKLALVAEINDWQSALHDLYQLTGSQTTGDAQQLAVTLDPALISYCKQREI